jgi:DNA-binding transcriptional ArsR family regulator
MLQQTRMFRLLADPTRRALLDLLLSGEKNAKELSAYFKTSQQAISLHLQSLRIARVVEVRKQGRYRRYRLRAEPIREIFEWSAKYWPFFDPYGHAWLFTNAPEQPGASTERKSAGPSRGRKPWS